MANEKQTYKLLLKTNRSLIKYILLSIITLGIYSIYTYYTIGEDINMIASGYDGKKTMNYALLFFLIGPITFGIGILVWMHRICKRIGCELERRQIPYSFGAGSYWGWHVLGVAIIVGPSVFIHKLCKAMNLLCNDYNVND
ncbi:MAG: DUF4234 domain-containing protein [Christensenellales bacterium]